jgi:cytochrome c553
VHKERRLSIHKIASRLAGPYVAVPVAAALLCIPVCAAAQDTEQNPARNLAAACASCHRADGGSQDGIAPLAGMPKTALTRKMQDFRSGAVPATVMQQIAKGYSGQQLDLIAAWFAAQQAGKQSAGKNTGQEQKP